MDRIGRDDGRQQRGAAAAAAGHQIAGRDPAVADAAVDGRAQLGEFQVELGLAHRRLVGGDRRLGIAIGLRPLLEDLLGDRLVVDELLGAVEIGLGEDDIGLGLRQHGARLVERVLERPLVDGEQQVALVHQLAVLEMHAVEIAGDARAHLHGVHGDEAADIFVIVGDRLLHRLGHGHGRRRRRGGLLLLLLLAACRNQQGQRQRQGEAPRGAQ